MFKGNQIMRLQDIQAIQRDYLKVVEVCSVLHTRPETFRGQAHQCPWKIGFPVIVIGTRVKIPKIPFLKYMRGELITEELPYA